MNKEQAKYYLQSSGFSEEQVQTVIDALEMPYKKALEDIRADIVMYKADGDLSNDDTCRRCGGNVFGSILRIIDTHNPDKVGKGQV